MADDITIPRDLFAALAALVWQAERSDGFDESEPEPLAILNDARAMVAKYRDAKKG